MNRLVLTIVTFAIFSMCLSFENIPAKILNTMKDKSSPKELFKTFDYIYKKNYDMNSALARSRYATFKKNLALMKENPTMGFTEFFDLTDEEFKEQIGFELHVDKERVNLQPNISQEGGFAPINWHTHQCSTKLPFSTGGDMCFVAALGVTSSIEFAQCQKSGKNTPLSLQQLIDCSDSANTFCNKFEYYLYKTGLTTADKYPWVSKAKGKCKDTTISAQAKLNSWEYSPYMWTNMALDIGTIYSALSRGPILTGFNFYKGLSTYSSGILTPTDAGKTCSYYWWGAVFGYGVQPDGKEYWIVKGYAGSNWGENGYFKLARGDGFLNYGISCGYTKPQF